MAKKHNSLFLIEAKYKILNDNIQDGTFTKGISIAETKEVAQALIKLYERRLHHYDEEFSATELIGYSYRPMASNSHPGTKHIGNFKPKQMVPFTVVAVETKANKQYFWLE